MNSTAHILVIDDDTRLRELLAQYLHGEGYRVTIAQNAEDARQKMKSSRFDLLIMDVMMPGEDGLQLTASLRKESNIPILMLTALGEPEDRIHGLEVGADDYLSKPFQPRELCLRINKMLNRKGAAASGPVQFGEFSFHPDTGVLYKGQEPLHLTSTELTLLRVFAERLNVPVSREELSSIFNGISERSIDVQVNRLRKKIEIDPKRPHYLHTHRGEGYVLRSQG